jgi:hypothetical protein
MMGEPKIINSKCEAPRPQDGASRARSGEQDASKGNLIHIVPLNPVCEAGLSGHAPVKMVNGQSSALSFSKSIGYLKK